MALDQVYLNYHTRSTGGLAWVEDKTLILIILIKGQN